ncbi:DDE-domain-containing protein [Aulographum hederae CBS 113979]|uniref:DDE-domain-containing protein n=1 Tax=Aulographum hederae CBS 113979 TaxID=1176131 RepID=A0A6G1H2A6_9PEZI|nr:DDE-domain-containing protein [Aulographum hederae CBS 113979]
MEALEILAQNTYNMDEKGFLIGVLNKMKRVYSSQNPPKGAGQDGNRNWITIIATICADGTSLPPGIIYAGGGDLQYSWLVNWSIDKLAFFSSTPSGWTNDELGLSWLQKVFKPYSKNKPGFKEGQYRLLFIDGHGSHLTVPFIKYCIQHDIILVAYPPHSTHRLQPLDVSLFSPLSTYYSQNLNERLFLTQGLSGISQKDFFDLVWPAYLRAFTESNILSGFRKTGLYPLDAKQVLSQLPSRPDPQKELKSGDTSSRNMINCLLFEAFAGSDVSSKSRQKIAATIHELATQNQILNAENSGLRETIKMEKKKRIPRQRVMEKYREPDSKAAFFTPAKVAKALDEIANQEKNKKLENARKAAEKKAKEVTRQEKQGLQKEKQTERKEAQKKRLEDKESKARDRAEIHAANAASRQLQNENKGVRARKPRLPQTPKKINAIAEPIDEYEDSDDEEGEAAGGRRICRPRRKLCLPLRFQE